MKRQARYESEFDYWNRRWRQRQRLRRLLGMVLLFVGSILFLVGLYVIVVYMLVTYG